MLTVELEDLYEYEQELLDEDEADCLDGCYYLGTVFAPTQGHFLLDYRVATSLLFRFDYSLVIQYVREPYPSHILFGGIEIVQLAMEKDMHYVVLKTCWLRIFQRTWRRFYQEKTQWLANVKQNIISFMTPVRHIPREPPFVGCFWGPDRRPISLVESQ